MRAPDREFRIMPRNSRPPPGGVTRREQVLWDAPSRLIRLNGGICGTEADHPDRRRLCRSAGLDGLLGIPVLLGRPPQKSH
jgi:hypothetical protein